MFQSQPYMTIIGLIYGAFIGAVIAKTITEDNYKKQESTAIVQEVPVSIDVTPYLIESTVTTIAPIPTTIAPIPTTTTLPMAELSEKTKNTISPDKTKRCPQWEDKFVEYGLPPKLFSYIAWRESRCNPKAHNTTLNRDGSQDLGLLQVNSTWVTVTRNICGTSIDGLFNIDCNLSVAKYLYDNGGAGHWSL